MALQQSRTDPNTGLTLTNLYLFAETISIHDRTLAATILVRGYVSKEEKDAGKSHVYERVYDIPTDAVQTLLGQATTAQAPTVGAVLRRAMYTFLKTLNEYANAIDV